MSRSHEVVIAVKCMMDEMDGTPEESAEIAAIIIEEAVAKYWDADAEVYVISTEEA